MNQPRNGVLIGLSETHLSKAQGNSGSGVQERSMNIDVLSPLNKEKVHNLDEEQANIIILVGLSPFDLRTVFT